MGLFEIRDDFYLNGEPFKIISGSIHYFRVVPEYWLDRLEKMKALGCNTVETYVPWNMHEPKKGEYCFEGMLDIKRFLLTAQQLGLYAIVRPSPYICAEWEFGGMPAWLLNAHGVRLRSSESAFLSHVESYYQRLLDVLKPLQINFGGPVILMQVENEYGAYSDDKAYLDALKTMMCHYGVTVPLITSDGPWNDYLACGSLPDVLPTANFGSKSTEQLAILKQHVIRGPLMCTEFWNGWFDHWGCGKHNTTEAAQSAADLDDVLKLGSVNLYMFHGGTNFGFMNGANYYEKLMPDVTSYDYDAPLSEDGRPTAKYEAFQKVISKYTAISEVRLSTQISWKAYGELPCVGRVDLTAVLDDISEPIKSLHPHNMESLGQSYGYVLYRTHIPSGRKIEKIRLWNTADRAIIFIDGKHALTLYDRELHTEHTVSWDSGEDGLELDILVENMGRVNYGPHLENQRKGILGDVLLNSHIKTNWLQYSLPLDAIQLSGLDFTKRHTPGETAFHQFNWDAEELCDTFLDMSGWGKGCVFLNSFNLGRFWEVGPQKRLYIPAPLIRLGTNELIIFETEGKSAESVTLYDNHL